MDNGMHKAVDDIIAHIEEQYHDLLRETNGPDNPLKKFIFLTEAINIMGDAPTIGIMKEAVLLRLYTLRSEVANDAEFIRIMYPETREM